MKKAKLEKSTCIKYSIYKHSEAGKTALYIERDVGIVVTPAGGYDKKKNGEHLKASNV